MGFYGNITNTSNTTFSFDRIYPNRLAMDANANNDGIFIGRYVLVEYQEEAAYPVAYHATETSEDSGQYYFYSSTNQEEISKIKYLGLPPGEPDRLPSVDDVNAIYQDGFYKGEILQRYIYSSDKKDWIFSEEFYVCVGEDDKHFAIFELIADPSMKSHYIQNFEIDEKHYGQESKGFKGYDSTVWMKSSVTATDGKLITKYVNIADLNSVVPTFDIAADAPTMNPITPHFDADSTNVYYKLHMQSPYGFRVAKKPEGGISDADTVWYETTYDKTQDKTETKKVYEGPADIYYNEAGFSPDAPSVVSNTAEDNYIKLEPTASSGATYSHGAGANDIQEFRLHLPAIGNMMSKAWDIVHGKQRNDYRGDGENASLQGRLDSFEGIKENQIPVKRNDGTLIGSKINNGKDYEHIGEILEKPVLDTDILENDDPWIRININTDGLVGGTQIGENPDQSNNNGILIQHTFHSTENSKTTIDKNTGISTQDEKYKKDFTKVKNTDSGTNDNLKLYTPYVDQTGHVVGYNEETVILPYGYKHFTTNGLVDETQSDLDNSIGRKTTASNTQDTLAIDTKNKWLQVEITDDKIEFAHEIHDIDIESNGHTNSNKEADAQQEDNLTIYDWTYDNAGHITSKKEHTYTLPFSYKVIKTLNSEGVGQADIDLGTNYKIMANKTQDEMQFEAANKWIGVMATEEGNVDKIYLGHLTNGNGFGKTYYAKDSTLSNDDVYKQIPNFGDNIKILNVTVDNAGHVTGFNANTITIPDGSYTPANEATPHTDIITSIGFVPSSGAITSTKANTDTLTLYNYSANSGNLDIKATDTINDGLKKVQNHINSLDMSSISTTEFITEITQTDGQIAVKRAKAGTLELGTDSTDKTVLGTDSLNQAINKIEARIKAEEENRKNAIDTLYGNNGEKIAETFDTIKEIADFLEQEDNDKQSGVEKIISDINTNAYNIAQEKLRAESAETALSTNLVNEITRATNAENANTNLINQEASRAQNKENEIVNNLNNEISRATEEEGKLNTRIDNLIGNTKVSTQIDNKINTFNSTLGSAAYTESDMYALAGSYDNRVLQSVYDTKIAELEATILALTARVEALEPESETPVEGE